MPGTTRRTTLLSVGNFDAATLVTVLHTIIHSKACLVLNSVFLSSFLSPRNSLHLITNHTLPLAAIVCTIPILAFPSLILSPWKLIYLSTLENALSVDCCSLVYPILVRKYLVQIKLVWFEEVL